jgi:hypothetical protein
MKVQFPEHEHMARSRVWLVKIVARFAGVLVHIDGMPYGSARRLAMRPVARVAATRSNA